MELKKKALIAVGREYGSGGRIISEALGKELGIPVFDKNMISMIAKKHGYDERALITSDERLSNPFFEPYSPYGSDTGALSEKLFLLQAEIIREEADKGPAIFIGRCADDILRKYDGLVNIFIYAPKPDRIRRIMEVDGIETQQAAEKALRRMDKARRSYYQFYTDRKWGGTEGHDLLINSSSLGIEGSVRLIGEFLKLKGFV